MYFNNRFRFQFTKTLEPMKVIRIKTIIW